MATTTKTPPSAVFQARLAETIDYLSAKAAHLPEGAVTQLRATHPHCQDLERQIEASVLAERFEETTTLCRAYCVYWLKLVREVAS